MSPDKARDALVDLAQETAEHLETQGWAASSAPLVGECGSDGHVNWGYFYATSALGDDRTADTERVAELWRAKGLEVRLGAGQVPAVFATGGPVDAISFTAGPATYTIAGTSLCVPGDLSKIIDEDYVD